MFRAAPLRNVALRAPYFHTGQVWSLKQAVGVMGSSQLGAKLTDEEENDIVAFLGALTGELPNIAYPIFRYAPNRRRSRRYPSKRLVPRAGVEFYPPAASPAELPLQGQTPSKGHLPIVALSGSSLEGPSGALRKGAPG